MTITLGATADSLYRHRMKCAPAIVVFVLSVTAGCSDDAKEPEAVASASPSASESAAVTLLEACPAVEAALPGGMIPKGPAMTELVAELDRLSADGDPETSNAIALLYKPALELESAVTVDASGSSLLDPLDEYIAGIDAFAKRCKAAGSSALQ